MSKEIEINKGGAMFKEPPPKKDACPKCGSSERKITLAVSFLCFFCTCKTCGEEYGVKDFKSGYLRWAF